MVICAGHQIRHLFGGGGEIPSFADLVTLKEWMK
jgi:hypothetical protein